MARRGDPELIYQAQRSGLFRRLVDAERLDELDAEHFVARWERHAEAIKVSRGTSGYWDEAWRWIEDELVAERGPLIHEWPRIDWDRSGR